MGSTVQKTNSSKKGNIIVKSVTLSREIFLFRMPEPSAFIAVTPQFNIYFAKHENIEKSTVIFKDLRISVNFTLNLLIGYKTPPEQGILRVGTQIDYIPINLVYCAGNIVSAGYFG